MAQVKRDGFSNRFGVLVATLGSAVGLGNLWVSGTDRGQWRRKISGRISAGDLAGGVAGDDCGDHAGSSDTCRCGERLREQLGNADVLHNALLASTVFTLIRWVAPVLIAIVLLHGLKLI